MSQTSEMGAMLLAARGSWVSMTEIGKVIGAWAVHSRAADLRRQGHAIENRIEVGKDGQKHSWYRLVVEADDGIVPSTGSQPQPCNHVWHTSTDGKAWRCIVCDRLEDSERAPSSPTAAAAQPHSLLAVAAAGAPRDLGLVFVTDGGIPD
jgi:hypothetical protein